MERLKKIIEQYGRWSELDKYADRIEAHISADFSIAIENAKALLESIGKEICEAKGISLDNSPSTNSIIKKAFSATGYPNSNMVVQISSALATIGQKIGELRNEIGATSHGRSIDELKERNSKVDELTREFLIDSTVIVACFLIRTFENKNPLQKPDTINVISYENNEEFNNYWDDLYGEFEMGNYSYTASEILYNVDGEAYVDEFREYSLSVDQGDYTEN